MGILKNIEWLDKSQNTLIYKIECNQNHINKGSVLTVRDSQVAIFCDKGRMADVFLPGMYKLDTNNIPLLTKLMAWKYGFETPFKSDVFFVNTKLFANQKWGTMNPIILRDKDFGAIRIRGYGSFSFKVSDAHIFMRELSGTNSTFKTEDINKYLTSLIITGISDAIGECKIPILDLAANLVELGKIVTKTLEEDFAQMGLLLAKFNVENLSLPEELEKAMDKNATLGMMRSNMDVYTQMAVADSLKDAAKNPGAGGTMNAGMGMGMGIGMGSAYGGIVNKAFKSEVTKTLKCGKCNANIAESDKFCPSCGNPNGIVCPKCSKVIAGGAKFCSECGASTAASCSKCNANLNPGAKFCPECGAKV